MKQHGVFFLLLLLPMGASAQVWEKLPSLPINKHPAPYFINSDTGFVYSETWLYGLWASLYFETSLQFYPQPGLWRTTDGGQTWANVPTLESVNLTQVYFVSRNHGFATAIGLNSGIYETKDCGLTWTKLKPAGQFNGVYAAGSHIFASAIVGDTTRGAGPIWHSEDNGNSWDSSMVVAGLPAGGTGFQFVYGNRDSLVATVYPVPITNDAGNFDYWLVYSTDLGAHWTSVEISTMKAGMMTLFIPPHECTVYRERNGGCSDPWRGFFSADYPYSNWNFSYQELADNSHNSLISAWMAGNACAQYSTYTSQQSGFTPSMYRHADQVLGTNWLMIFDSAASPNFQGMDFGDYRNVAVVGGGAIVYASDSHGDLWKTTDGGSDFFQLHSSELRPQLAFDHSVLSPQISTCQTDTLTAFYQNLGCSYATLDSIWIDGLNQNEYTQATLHHNPCVSLPDTTTFVVSAKTPGQRPLAIHARFLDDDYNQIDTTMPVVLDVIPSATFVPISLYLKSSSMTVHDLETISIPIYASANVALPGSTTITLPFALDTNILKVLSFDPAITGMSVGAIANSNGMETVPIQANDLGLNGETQIGTLRCVAYLADTLATLVSLVNASLTSENSPCVALSLTTDSVNISIQGCGDQTLLRFIKTGKIPLGIQSITPNPASNEIDIVFHSDVSQPIAYELIDALGHTRLHDITDEHIVSLDASSLPQGIYFFRASTNDGFAVTRKVLIEH